MQGSGFRNQQDSRLTGTHFPAVAAMVVLDLTLKLYPAPLTLCPVPTCTSTMLRNTLSLPYQPW